MIKKFIWLIIFLFITGIYAENLYSINLGGFLNTIKSSSSKKKKKKKKSSVYEEDSPEEVAAVRGVDEENIDIDNIDVEDIDIPEISVSTKDLDVFMKESGLNIDIESKDRK